MYVFIVLNVFCFYLTNGDGDIPDINDMFLTLHDDFNAKIKPPPKDAIIKNISINIDKLDINKIKEKMDYFAKKLTGDFDETELNNTRRTMEGMGRKYYDYSLDDETMVRLKILDLMLQLIYMARYKIKMIENDPYFNPQDTSYRIGYLYRKLRRIRKKMLDIYSLMEKRFQKREGKFRNAGTYLILLSKQKKLHNDYLYIWWVMIQMHEIHQTRHMIPNTRPPKTKATTKQD
ncbi:uncharacterized protein LOC121738600 [Aricia agestis]|uniref:uncharacterized protein LOC121738600 n=1 Tax=Aricia agestis TaxID=91739 RepID=UPI001C20B472|nr:uncharacterized protein LOC121738600 [Aricia agestis]